MWSVLYMSDADNDDHDCAPQMLAFVPVAQPTVQATCWQAVIAGEGIEDVFLDSPVPKPL